MLRNGIFIIQERNSSHQIFSYLSQSYNLKYIDIKNNFFDKLKVNLIHLFD